MNSLEQEFTICLFGVISEEHNKEVHQSAKLHTEKKSDFMPSSRSHEHEPGVLKYDGNTRSHTYLSERETYQDSEDKEHYKELYQPANHCTEKKYTDFMTANRSHEQDDETDSEYKHTKSTDHTLHTSTKNLPKISGSYETDQYSHSKKSSKSGSVSFVQDKSNMLNLSARPSSLIAGNALPGQRDKILQTQHSLHGQRESDEIRLVLVGRTGCGKSAVGNFLMAETHFESKLTGKSVTKECKQGISRAIGRKLVIVDTPGLFDTQLPYEKISQEIIRCIHMSIPGPHVFLLVVPITRLTDEEIQTFHRLFDIFGDRMGNYAIITFTRLDDLQRDKTTIETFIESSPPMLKTFLQQCKGRYFALNNNESNQNERNAKIKALIKMVDDIKSENGGTHYTNGMYREAEAHLQQKIQEAERKKTLEKEREVKKIESKFVHLIDNANKKNKELLKIMSKNEINQRKIKQEREKAIAEITNLKEELTKIDQIREKELYEEKKCQKKIQQELISKLECRDNEIKEILKNVKEEHNSEHARQEEIVRRKYEEIEKFKSDHDMRFQNEIAKLVHDNQSVMDTLKEENQDLRRRMEEKDLTLQNRQKEHEEESLKMFNKYKDELQKRDFEHQNQLEEQKSYIAKMTNMMTEYKKDMSEKFLCCVS